MYFSLPGMCSAEIQTFTLMQNIQISLAKLLQLSDIVSPIMSHLILKCLAPGQIL